MIRENGGRRNIDDTANKSMHGKKKKPPRHPALKVCPFSFENVYFYIKKLNRIPAATADPITPETLGAIACISR